MSVLKCFSEMDDETQEKARRTLRRELAACRNIATDDGEADAVIEQVWNALVGNPLADEELSQAA